MARKTTFSARCSRIFLNIMYAATGTKQKPGEKKITFVSFSQTLSPDYIGFCINHLDKRKETYIVYILNCS